ncbi:interaptin isoform X2 [Thrips palmi]|uniref:Interaptin isoform X2 n=1 Tax=Thrips palmi TaxID=161013 RepID=A0A6P8YGP2_THRPL|nr:interaptin isoform X2 [Thrips palmi]
MPQKSLAAESRLGSGNMESSPKLEGNSNIEKETKQIASAMHHLPKSGRQNKCLSAAANTSVFTKKRFLQSQAGVVQHPYQSSHPVHSRLDLNIASRDNLSSFTQRVMSAKLLRLKQLQNQLSEAHLQLNELCTENRLLRALQKRQDLALVRYEGTQAQLPQLVRSHQEEVRILRTKYKNLKHQCRSVTNTLKEREGELQNLKEQHAHLLKLSKDRNLGDREALTKQVNELKLTVENQSNTIQVLNRKVLLESKNLKFQLHQEMQRHRTTQSELQQTLARLDQLQSQLDQFRERSSLPPSIDRFGKTPSLSRLVGGQKSSRATLVEMKSPQNSRFKKVTKNSVTQGSVNNTDPSSMQLDSSPTTNSEKTNEFSTSLESSPEHTTNEIIARERALPLQMSTNPYQFHRSIVEKGKTDLNIHFDSLIDSKITDGNYSNGSLCDDVLEKEYENAVAMLSELSTTHKSNFVEDVSTLLPSLDLTSAKHVAALANATFALKGDPQFVSNTKSKQDHRSSSSYKKDLQQGEGAFVSNKKSQQTAVNEEMKHLKTRRVSDFQQESDLRSSSQDKARNLEMLKSKSKSTDNLMTDVEPPIQRQLSETDDKLAKTRQNNDEEVESSRKEALLKALKAIDDSSNQENGSDDSDSDIVKISASTVIPQRMFSSLNSPGVGVADKFVSRRSKPFK